MKRLFKFGFLSVVFSGLLFSACESYPGEDDYVTDQLAAFTAYDTSVKFKGTGKEFSSYSLGEGVVYINDNDTTFISWDNTGYPMLQNLKTQVQSEMTKYLGYTEETSGPVDMGISISIVKRDNYVVDYNPWWWDCGWYSYWWWDCGWYPYYPYPYPVVVGSYTTGTTFINMIDLTDNSSTQKKVVWTGVVRSLMTGTQTAADFNNAIDDCFKQTLAFQ